MAATLPMPGVPDLGPDNVLDLDKLGTADLETWVSYPGIAEGDEFWPTWWGRSALGQPVDDFNELVQIGPGDLKPQGMPVLISNAKLKALDQGVVFYSYRKDEAGERGEESLRRYFYVGNRPSTSLLLPVPQFKESHALAVDPAGIGPGGATVVTVPYQAMSPGDTVTLTLERYFGENDPWTPLVYPKLLNDTDVGRPLRWTISKNEFQVIVNGFAHMSYSIDYATPTVTSVSASQTLYIIPPPDTLLPPPEVEGYADGDELDPDLFLDGLRMVIPQYPGIQVDDEVVVYAKGDTSLVKTLRVDPSTIDSKILELNLEHAWLLANNGMDISLQYQYARAGTAGTSRPLSLTLRKPLILPLPNVETATPDGEGKGFLLANNITGGVYVTVPDEAVIGVGDKVQMHWEGYGAIGSHIADPTFGNARRFYIPSSAIPANMGKRLEVFYKVTPPGKNSKVFDLEIKDMTTGWPTLQISSPPSAGNRISLAAATNGVVFKLASWTYMSSGQRIKMKVEGLLASGEKEIFNLRTGDAEVVSEAENNAREIVATLPRVFLARLQLDQQFNVSISASFDGGDTYKNFPPINPLLLQ